MEGYKPPHDQPEEERRRFEHEQAVEGEELRLRALEQVKELGFLISHWSAHEDREKIGAQVRAAYAALDMVAAILRGDDKEVAKRNLDDAAMSLGYHLVEGEYEGAPSAERREQVRKNLEEWDKERGQGRS